MDWSTSSGTQAAEQQISGGQIGRQPPSVGGGEHTTSMAVEVADTLDKEPVDEQTIAQRILAGTWPAQSEEEGTNGPPEALPDRFSYERRVVRGNHRQPCDACRHEFFYGDVFYQQPFQRAGEGEKLCKACYDGRFGMESDPSSGSSDSRSQEDIRLDSLPSRPLHAEPQVEMLARQGGSMGGIRQHIQQEMQRLLGSPSLGSQPGESGALPPLTPRQLIQARSFEAGETPHRHPGQGSQTGQQPIAQATDLQHRVEGDEEMRESTPFNR